MPTDSHLETRKVILPPIIKQVLSRMEKHEEKAECIQVVKVILNCIQTQIVYEGGRLDTNFAG